MKRRDFLVASGLMLISSKFLYDSLIDFDKKEKIYKIFNELPNHCHLCKTDAKMDVESEHNKKHLKGYGIVQEGYYFTPAHITDCSNRMIRTPFGIVYVSEKVLEKKVSLYGKELEEIVFKPEKEIAIYKIPKELNLPNFPAEFIDRDIRYGEDVYLIGNPRLEGTNVRKGIISDLNGFNHDSPGIDAFGMNIPVIPGDSGTPIVNEDFKLIGLTSYSIVGVLGYGIRINSFKKELENLKPNKSSLKEKIIKMPIINQ